VRILICHNRQVTFRSYERDCDRRRYFSLNPYFSMELSPDSNDSWPICVPPISRDGFLCIGNRFLVEVNAYQHERKPAHELYELLTYTPQLLTKTGKVAKHQPSIAHKDPDAHVYCAQLIHYGLKPLKTKGPRKEETLRGVWRWKYSRSSTSPFRIRGIASEGMARSEHRRSKRNQKKMRDAACYKGEKKPTRK